MFNLAYAIADFLNRILNDYSYSKYLLRLILESGVDLENSILNGLTAANNASKIKLLLDNFTLKEYLKFNYMNSSNSLLKFSLDMINDLLSIEKRESDLLSLTISKFQINNN